LAGIGTGIFMFTLDGSIVNVALPTLVTELGTSFATVQWIVLAYLLVVSSSCCARMGDLYGKKRITSAASHCSPRPRHWRVPDVRWLIAMRAVQGLGGVFVAALGAAIIAEIFPPRERGRALGFIGTSVLLGVALGPTLGGLILHYASWRWMFLVNIPIGILVITLLGRVLPPCRLHGRAGPDWPAPSCSPSPWSASRSRSPSDSGRGSAPDRCWRCSCWPPPASSRSSSGSGSPPRRSSTCACSPTPVLPAAWLHASWPSR
jgi:MFS family permease